MSNSDSVIFDRAVDYYDRTRSLPEDVMERVIDLLTDELTDKQPCLEIGVGTGRMALPLHERGIGFAGIDLSEPMLHKLVANAGGQAFPLAIADTLALPFESGSFGSAMASHVLHLIPAWREAVAEVVRVTRPGGTFVVSVGSWGREVSFDIQQHWAREAGIEARHAGVNDIAEVDEEMDRRGAPARSLEPVRGSRAITYEEEIRRLEEGVFSFTWKVDPETRKGAAQATRSWAQEQFGDLGAEHDQELVVEWRAYDLPR